MNYKNTHKTNCQKTTFRSQIGFAESASDHSKPHMLHHGSLHEISGIAKQVVEVKETKDRSTGPINLLRRNFDQEYKRFNSQTTLPQMQTTIGLQEEYDKWIKGTAKIQSQQKSSIGSRGSRQSDESQPKQAENLKTTSSTNSAENFCLPKKQIPAFLKQKSKLVNKMINGTRIGREGFKILKKLGEGKFGKVFLAIELSTGFVLAMKVVQKKKVLSDNIIQQFIRELKIQMVLKHPNIIEVYGFFEDQKYFYTLMELGCDGQLYNLIQQKKKITEEGTSFIAKNLLQAVDHMHSLKILHRDIKPENIVRIMGNVKICDFGWAANKATKEELRSTYCGTPLYLSPEILKGHKYDEKVDLWAIGILAYQLLLGKSPFDICEHQDLYKIMTDEVRFPHDRKISKEFQEFIANILNKDPKERLNSSQLLELKFIQKYDGFETCSELCD